jgi:DNA repair protein SbcC/Rad50
VITFVELQNFQCHQNLAVDLERVTVLVGDNEAGKSAVIRALKWCLLNEWDGPADDFIAWGQTFAEVFIVKDEHKIVRKKGKGVNCYALDGQVYADIGTKVPLEVAEVVNLSVDNFQDQQDAAFWLMLQPGDAARALNELFNLDAIDTTATNIAAEVRQAKAEVGVSRGRLAEAKATLADLEWLDQAEEEFAEIETLASEIETIVQEARDLQGTWERLQKAEYLAENAEVAIVAGNAVLDAAKNLSDVDWQIDKLKNLIKWETYLAKTTKALKAKESELEKLLKESCPLCGRKD